MSKPRIIVGMDRKVHSHNKLSKTKCQKAKAKGSFVPTVEEEATEARHLLAEPKTDHAVDDFFYFDGLDFSSNQEHDELALGVLDGLLDDVDEVDDIDAANDISGACENFLLDAELARVCDLDSIPYKGSHLGNSSTESQSPGSSGDVLGLSESSTGTALQSGSKDGLLERSVKCEARDLCREKLDFQTLDEYERVTVSHDLENADELDNDAMLVKTYRSTGRIKRKSVQLTGDCASLRQKRLRKPTKRYIEEFSNPTEHVIERQCSSKDKEMKIRSKSDAYALEGSFRETIAEMGSTDTEDVLDMKLKHLVKRQKIPSNGSKDKRSKLKSDENKYNVRAFTHAPKDSSLDEAISHESCKDIRELSQSNREHLIIRYKLSSGTSTDKNFKTRSQDEIHWRRAPKSATGGEPSESQRQRGRPRKSASFLALECGNQYTENRAAKRRKSKMHNDRRKCQIMWTLEEATKLIDGIAQCGPGRWTDIKRLHFSLSPHRTPIDLRDKWRNLLRASYAEKQKQNKKEEEQEEETQKHTGRALPASVLHQVRELASMHPYPRFAPGGAIFSISLVCVIPGYANTTYRILKDCMVTGCDESCTFDAMKPQFVNCNIYYKCNS